MRIMRKWACKLIAIVLILSMVIACGASVVSAFAADTENETEVDEVVEEKDDEDVEEPTVEEIVVDQSILDWEECVLPDSYYDLSGYNVDDVRDLLGLRRHQTKRYIVELIEFADEAGLYSSEEEMETVLAKYKLTNVARIGLEEMQQNLDLAVERLGESISSGQHADVVFSNINQVEYYSSKVDNYYKADIEVTYEYGTATSFGTFENKEDANTFVQYALKEYEEPGFVVGHLGTGLRPYTENIWSLTKAFGVTKNAELVTISNEITNKNITDSNINILSQFNGVVTELAEDGEFTYKITVKHGPYMSTEYTGVTNIRVGKGDYVSQYDKIGEITADSESSLRVMVDGEYVNPLLLFGADGALALHNLMAREPGVEFDISFLDDIKTEPEESDDLLDKVEADVYAVLDESAGHIDYGGTEFIGGFVDNNTEADSEDSDDNSKDDEETVEEE